MAHSTHMFRIALVLLLSGFLFSFSAPLTSGHPSGPEACCAAPQQLEGTYEATRVNGDPIVPGHTVEVVITRKTWGWSVTVTLVGEDGSRRPIPREDMIVVWDATRGYQGNNSRGHDATYTPKGGGEWEVEMTSGPNSGNKTKLTPATP